MRTTYKVLTLLILAGLFCYSGRSLNMEAENGLNAEILLKQTPKKSIFNQGEMKMFENTATNHAWNKTKENIHLAKDDIEEKAEKLWDKTKEDSKKIAHKISEKAEKVVDETKEMSTKTQHQAKNVSKEASDKAKYAKPNSDKLQKIKN